MRNESRFLFYSGDHVLQHDSRSKVFKLQKKKNPIIIIIINKLQKKDPKFLHILV